ncbi:MAG: hypothetical protein ACYC7D_11395 [Nitrososphaerales archaeon]
MTTTDRQYGQNSPRTGIARVVFVGVLIFVVVVAGSLSYYFFSSTGRPAGNADTSTSSVSCYKNNSCFVDEPVVDVIIPKLSQSLGSNEVGNNVLNVTRGESVSLTVMVYSTINLNAMMKLELFPPNDANASSSNNTNASTSTSENDIIVEFNPSSMSISKNGQGSTVMALNVSTNAQLGVYSAAVSAFDIDNPFYFWGAFFHINVQE